MSLVLALTLIVLASMATSVLEGLKLLQRQSGS